VDFVKAGVDLELEYGVLAKLCAEMLDANCAGVYVRGYNLLFRTTARCVGSYSGWRVRVGWSDEVWRASTVKKGLDLDRPRNLVKSVTLE
jgi:hypothetical protein